MQVKKKAAKKTYKSSAKKKTVPELKRVTMDELKAIVAETSRTMAENHAKTEAKMEAARAETEVALKAAFEKWEVAHAKTEAAIDRLSVENEKTLVSVKEASVRSEKAIARIDAALDRMEDNFGGISKRLGDLAEIIVVPKIKIDINKLGGHNFQDTVADKTVVAVVDGIKGPIAEVDMLLFGDGEAMAVEIKSHLKKTKVDDHLRRLQKLRTYENEAGIAGKKLFGAVVGVIVDDEARKHALKNGLYVIEIREEEDKLDIDKPDACRTW
jgi:hypothetical protein